VEQYELEVAVARKLNHPNIAKIYETYQDKRYFFIVMEYCEGGELLEYISNQDHLDEK
jgi:calcium-dependent protein kinase